MSSIPTIRVTKASGDEVIINEQDFDPDIHTATNKRGEQLASQIRARRIKDQSKAPGSPAPLPSSAKPAADPSIAPAQAGTQQAPAGNPGNTSANPTMPSGVPLKPPTT